MNSRVRNFFAIAALTLFMSSCSSTPTRNVAATGGVAITELPDLDEGDQINISKNVVWIKFVKRVADGSSTGIEFSSCSGTVISGSSVLTAGHCVADLSPNDQVIIFSGTDLIDIPRKVRINPNWNGSSKSNVYSSKGKKYNEITPSRPEGEDIALIEVDPKEIADAHLWIGHFSESNPKEVVSKTVYFVGSGLKELNAPKPSFPEEVRWTGYQATVSHMDEFGYGYLERSGATSALPGDSGGPVYMKEGDHLVQIGVMSWISNIEKMQDAKDAINAFKIVNSQDLRKLTKIIPLNSTLPQTAAELKLLLQSNQ